MKKTKELSSILKNEEEPCKDLLGNVVGERPEDTGDDAELWRVIKRW